jgi:glyoxylase-like metal-dependent hydrolase (beta-lactamase superfamily II)
MTPSIYLKQIELGPMANYVYFVGTHSHFDHINGVEDLLHRTKAQVYINKAEAEFMKGVWPELVKVDSGDRMRIGDVDITFIHTPGHTPGSQCFLVNNHLISGDRPLRSAWEQS